ncbi:MAG: OsmC family protein [Pseudonocardia sp.]|nr:OsmC family protein [Pseudonocardia sp.]
MTSQLARVATTSRMTTFGGRAVASMRGRHMVVDSPLPLGGPNEEVNPLELLLASLATCAIFVCETAARESDIPLSAVTAHVEGEFDVRGVCGEPVDPHIQAFYVTLTLQGPDDAQAGTLVEAFQTRCPIFTTLSRAAPIDIQVHLQESASI